MAAKWPWAKIDEIRLVMKSGWPVSLLFLRHCATKYSSGLLLVYKYDRCLCVVCCLYFVF